MREGWNAYDEAKDLIARWGIEEGSWALCDLLQRLCDTIEELEAENFILTDRETGRFIEDTCPSIAGWKRTIVDGWPK